MKLNENYKAIIDLDKLLTEEAIPHDIGRAFDGWIIEYRVDGWKKGDAIQHMAVHRAEHGVMEVWGFGLKEPVRCYTVAEAAEFFRKAWEEDSNQ